jgi:membrane protease YdiL (CAAX protease family)
MNKKELRQEFIGFIGFFYALPIFLLYIGLIPFRVYYSILMLMGLILAAYSIQKGITAKNLGFRGDNLKKALTYSVVLSVVLVALVYVLFRMGIIKDYRGAGEGFWFLVFYVFISAPIQEFIFRSLMFFELKQFLGKRKWLIILVSAIIFSLAHAFFKSWGVIAVTFMAGLFWGWMYNENQNFWGVAISHALIGAVAVILGIV